MSSSYINIGKPPEDAITIWGPMWQPECDRCDWMSAPYDSYEEAQAAAQKHECSTSLPEWVTAAFKEGYGPVERI